MRVDNWTYLTQEQVTSVGRARYVYGTLRYLVFTFALLVFVYSRRKSTTVVYSYSMYREHRGDAALGEDQALALSDSY
jgi:hypothetical protein